MCVNQSILILSYKSTNKRRHKDGLTVYFTSIRFATENTPRTLLVSVASVVQKIIKTFYDAHFPNAEDRSPGRTPECPDSDILVIGGLLEYIGVDSEHSGYRRLKVELKTVFPCLPERSHFNRRRRNLSGASEVLRRVEGGGPCLFYCLYFAGKPGYNSRSGEVRT